MHLRPAQSEDLDFIVAQEARNEVAEFILPWSLAEHQINLQQLDKQYKIFESNQGEKQGYAILAGFQLPHQCIELTRIVIAQPGRGYGKTALRLLMQEVFVQHQAHRLWLDVFEHNQRARQVYESIGFQTEGKLREAVKRGEKYYPLVIMSILKYEYFERLSHKLV
ncbi:GNAT family N-acetyltransferase [Leptolyngbya sp. FACHB-261]|uniref:GNAT family N-acetyltransferase n=1 Tax=Leptolyngbya sp. FACHB-261 TaxID=2692806 RepID=UPI00168A1AC4|nr:GNAT family protein [Leptolyngbya sp. FACHB-261]MBD2101217.1 GNAT family N-acetyltransferase [Leptolyngbya sp. FACHB-261]